MSEPQNLDAEKPETETTESKDLPSKAKFNRRDSIKGMVVSPFVMSSALAIEGVLEMPLAAILEKAATSTESFLPLLKKAADLAEPIKSELISALKIRGAFTNTTKPDQWEVFEASKAQLQAIEDIYINNIKRKIQECIATEELIQEIKSHPETEDRLKKLSESFEEYFDSDDEDHEPQTGYYEIQSNYVHNNIDEQRSAAINAAKFIIKKSLKTAKPINKEQAELYLKIVATCPTIEPDKIGGLLASEGKVTNILDLANEFSSIAEEYRVIAEQADKVIPAHAINNELNKLRDFMLGATKKAFPELADYFNRMDLELRNTQTTIKDSIEKCNQSKPEKIELEEKKFKKLNDERITQRKEYEEELEERKSPLVSSERLVQEIFAKEGIKWAERKKAKAIETLKAR